MLPESSPLTPRRGFAMTLAQVGGERPNLTIGCSRCHYFESGLPVNVEARTDAELGAAVREALTRWEGHMCQAPYPSEGGR